MTRPTYGGAGGDIGADLVGGYWHAEGGVAQVWSARTGGSPITDLQTVNGDAITAVTVPADGSVVLVKMPDGYTGEAWIGPSAGPRVRLTPPSGGGGSSNSDVASYVTGSGATKDALIAAFVARPAGGTDGQVLTKSGSNVVWGAGGGAGVALVAADTDGVPYFDAAGIPGSTSSVLADTDGTPYFAIGA